MDFIKSWFIWKRTLPVVCSIAQKEDFGEYFESRNYFVPGNTKTNWVNFWKYIFYREQDYRRKYFKIGRGAVVSSQKIHQKHEPAQNEPRKDWENLRLFLGNWNRGMEQMFISGDINGWNQRFYKLKSQVLQINSAVYFKRRRKLCHKGRIHVRPFFDMKTPA